MIGGIDSFPLLAVPFFILAGNLMNNAGITNRIYNFALALVGWLKGGLGHVNVVGSVIFAGMSGTAIADAAGLGTIEIKAMKDHGYSSEFAVGVTAASATLGPIIPPSLPFVIYGMMANVSVGALFLAGLLPGLLMALLMMLTVAYFAHKNNWGGDIKFSRPPLRQGADRAGGGGGLAAGDLLPGAGRAARAARRCSSAWRCCSRPTAFQVAGGAADHDAGAADRRHDHRHVHAHRRRHRGQRLGDGAGPVLVPHADLEDVRQGQPRHRGDDGDGDVHRRRRVDLRLDAHRHRRHRGDREWVLASPSEPWVFLLLANLLMLFVGCFLEPTAAITILVPMLLPIATQLGIDPVHFGLVMVLNLMIGLLHPPMGMVLFVLARVAKLSVERTTVAILPWLVPLLLSLALLTYVPAIGLWLPRTLGFLAGAAA